MPYGSTVKSSHYCPGTLAGARAVPGIASHAHRLIAERLSRTTCVQRQKARQGGRDEEGEFHRRVKSESVMSKE
eukprot:2324442-Rhodomonas_salina.1